MSKEKFQLELEGESFERNCLPAKALKAYMAAKNLIGVRKLIPRFVKSGDIKGLLKANSWLKREPPELDDDLLKIARACLNGSIREWPRYPDTVYSLYPDEVSFPARIHATLKILLPRGILSKEELVGIGDWAIATMVGPDRTGYIEMSEANLAFTAYKEAKSQEGISKLFDIITKDPEYSRPKYYFSSSDIGLDYNSVRELGEKCLKILGSKL